MKRAHSSSGSARVLRAVSLSRREAIYSAILLFVAAFFVLRLSQYSRRQIPARLISLTTTQTRTCPCIGVMVPDRLLPPHLRGHPCAD